MVCFPYAGGAASYFHGVSSTLTPAVEVLAIQYPGRQDRRTEPHAYTVDEPADLRPPARHATIMSEARESVVTLARRLGHS